jgi:HEAT repeat protein
MLLDEKRVMEHLDSDDAVQRITALDAFRNEADSFGENERWAVILKAVEDQNWTVREEAIQLGD